MNKNNFTTYSLVGSLGLHVLITLGAGNFLMNINNSVQPQKTYQMEFVKRKAPPPVKKETIRKERVRKEIKVASLSPKAMPVLQPKVSFRQTSRQTRKARAMVKTSVSTPRYVKSSFAKKTVMMRSDRPLTAKRIPVARSFVHTRKTSSSKAARVSMVQGAPRFKSSKLPSKVVRSESLLPAGTEQGPVAPVQTRVKLASLTSFPSVRGVPNFDDSGARASYTAIIQRRIEESSKKEYPKSAMKSKRQGVLNVQFTILKDGQLGNVRLITKTEYPELNRAAMAAVKKAAPFAGIPDSIIGQSLSFIVPIKFRVN